MPHPSTLFVLGAAMLAAGCLSAEDEAPSEDNLSSTTQEIGVAPLNVAQWYGFNARSINAGFPAGALRIPVVIVESTKKEIRIPITVFGSVVWIEVWDNTLNHESEFYRKLVFGGVTPNATDYFAEESHDKLTLVSAGRSNRLDMRSAPSETGAYQAALKIAAGAPDAGNFDFTRYDTNGDGKVENTELWILNIDGGSTTGNHNGGSNRRSDPRCPDVVTRNGTIKVCSTIIHVGDTVGFQTLVHELSHVLGTHDLYGRWNVDSNFSAATVMGATIFATPDDRRTLYHDGWHRFQLGWERPSIVDLLDPDQRTGSHFLLPPGAWTGNGNILIFGGVSYERYLLVEYRRPEGYDRDVRGDALYVWSVEQDGNKNLRRDADFRNYYTLYLGPEICTAGVWDNAGPGLSGCETLGNWDTTVPVDGAWRQFYLPNSAIHPRVRVVRSGDGARVEWQSMECEVRPGGGGSSCRPYQP